ncbi:DUF4145 domain-containing protein [Pseudomonadota bacterium]
MQFRKVACNKTQGVIRKEFEDKAQLVSTVFEANKFFGILAGVGFMATSTHKEPAKFICFFKCEECKSDVAAAGTSQYPSSNVQNNIPQPLVKVEHFSPPIPMFKISASVPDIVVEEVFQSFNHFHSDYSSSGAKLRKAIERLCEELGYDQHNLGKQIKAMEEKYPGEAELLNSLRLLGNEATHSYSVNEHDLLVAYEVLEHVLGIFDRLEIERIAQGNAQKLLQKFDKKSNK